MNNHMLLNCEGGTLIDLKETENKNVVQKDIRTCCLPSSTSDQHFETSHARMGISW